MSQVDRFTVSLDTELLAAFDRHIADRGYENRSEAIRDLIRDLLVTSRLLRGDEPVTAVLTLICDHRTAKAPMRLRTCLAANTDLVCGSLNVTVNEHCDSMAIGLKGPADKVQALADQMQAMRGVTHGHLSAVPVNE